MRPTRCRLLAFLLLLCLVFAQAAAGAHALAHLPAAHGSANVLDAPDGDGRGASHVCLECLAGHGLDFAAPPALGTWAPIPLRPATPPTSQAAPRHARALRPNSRAPPAFL